MSDYKTTAIITDRNTDKPTSKPRKIQYKPRGALCWFECDKHGKHFGDIIWIKNVPENNPERKIRTGLSYAFQHDFRTITLTESASVKRTQLRFKQYKRKKKGNENDDCKDEQLLPVPQLDQRQ